MGECGDWQALVRSVTSHAFLLACVAVIAFPMPAGAHAGHGPGSAHTHHAHQADSTLDALEGLDESMAPATQVDVYGVVASVEDLGPAPSSELFTPSKSPETLQKVTVRLEPSSRGHGFPTDTVVVENVQGDNPAYNIPVHVGARVLLNAEKHPQSGDWTFYLANRDRTPALFILGTVLMLAILLIGGSEVTKHVLLTTVILVGGYTVLFPSVLAGTGAFGWALAMCFMFTILGSFIYRRPDEPAWTRFTPEQSVVILGTVGGLALLSLILTLMGQITPLSGVTSEGLASLWYQSPTLDYWGFFLSGAVLGFQGFVFYLCWMLAQDRRDGPVLSRRQRFDIVMTRGRRLLGPMLSSLGLLFVGLYLSLLLQMQGTPRAQFANLESTVSVLVVVFSGMLTLVLCVPLTAWIAAWRLSSAKEADTALNDALPRKALADDEETVPLKQDTDDN